MNASRISVIILVLWVVFLGAVWGTWVAISPHNLGILSVVVGVIVLLVELFTVWHPWRRA